MTPQELLNLKVDGNSTLHDIFNLHLIEGQFGNVDDDEQLFFLQLAQKIIDAVKA